jgi:hypothetical protein
MALGTPITLRLTIDDPIPGITYSLCDKSNAAIDPVVATGGPVSLDVPVRLAPGPRFLGEYVRSEGPTRRFVYVGIDWNQSPASPCSGRMKIDIQNIEPHLLEAALNGAVLETVLNGRGKRGGPAYATVAKTAWRIT